MFDSHCIAAHPALVAKIDAVSDSEKFLQITDAGARWIGDWHAATAFESMREAMRMAFRLPASDRAYGVPSYNA